ncbi:hypothetical protein GGR56DRAFT_47116 [Xylariaceae sp. FL0804]|nr:hypothetical protein GGR56DRAFT_47116 [Xylariaceae sp. FL0804]
MDVDLRTAGAVLHYVYPLAVFVYFATASSVAACTLQNNSDPAKTAHRHYKSIWYLLLLFIGLFGMQAIVKIFEVLSSSRWPSQDATLGLLSCILVFGIQQNALPAAQDVVWYPYYGSWLLSLVFEPPSAVLWFIAAQRPIHDLHGHAYPGEAQVFRLVDAAFSVARSVTILVVLLLFFIGRARGQSDESDEEQSPLIPKTGQNLTDASTDSGYGTNTESASTGATNTDAAKSTAEGESPWERRNRQTREKIEKRLQSEGNWISYVKGFQIFLPYVWPVGNCRLQLHVALVVVLLLAGNGLNFLIPRQYGTVMDSLSGATTKNPWIEVIVFAALRLLSSEAGIDLLRSLLWLPVQLYSQEAISIAAYSHVMNLSSEFHDTQSSSDLLVAINSGQTISSLLESIFFQAVPMVIDLVVAFTYLSIKFGPYEGFITVATGLAFIQAATQIISRFQDKRKNLVKAYFEEHYARQAGIQGWHTVCAFNQIPYEQDRYSHAMKANTSAYKSLLSGYYLGYALQYLILLVGLLAGAFLAVYQITRHQATAGDFIMLLTYWGQLTSPLRFFASLGRQLSQTLVHAERLLEVMMTKPTVNDKPGARPIKLKGGEVEFRNVSFSYDKKKDILKGVKLSAAPGATVAFVGATGAGKSTILKLLDRFYDVTGGSILIDKQDIRDVTMSSLRQCIGIVPQSPILFDDSVMNNIRYARLGATDEEVFGACKAAAIHDQIMGFTEGYQSRVGERGVKLSGGELQRIAIARAILKRPDIVLLDEATSSVDTDTEQKIQDGLSVLCQGRTTFVVAHRLSTVMNADVIFVIDGGEVVEQGGHEELIAKNGRYAELWSKQIFVKAQDPKNDTNSVEKGKETEGSGPQPGQGAQTDGSADAHSSRASASTTVQRKSALKDEDAQADGEAVTTPKGHKKEVDPSKNHS